MQIFSKLYPELVEKNTIKYPIEDALISKTPELHGGLPPPKPKPYKVLIDADSFEKILYVWEFCNNFVEYTKTPSFKIEDLRVAMTFSIKDQE